MENTEKYLQIEQLRTFMNTQITEKKKLIESEEFNDIKYFFSSPS